MIKKIKYGSRFHEGEHYDIILGGYTISFFDWSIHYDYQNQDGETWHYALRCNDCRRWSLGCTEHWFCGICQTCKDNDDEP